MLYYSGADRANVGVGEQMNDRSSFFYAFVIVGGLSIVCVVAARLTLLALGIDNPIMQILLSIVYVIMAAETVTLIIYGDIK